MKFFVDNESLFHVQPQDNFLPADDQGPTLYTLQIINPLSDDRQPDQPSLVYLQKINPISDPTDENRQTIPYKSNSGLDHPSYVDLQQINSIADDEVEPEDMGYAYLNFINPILDDWR